MPLVATEHPIVAGLEGQSFRYGDDIETATLLTPSDGATEVLAWATVNDVNNCAQKPVVVAYTPNRAAD